LGNRTLVAYESKGGATQESAKKIAETLRSKFQLEVDVVDMGVQKVPDCSTYQNIVIGGGVRGGKIYGKTLKCLENDFSGKKVAFFVCAGGAGDPKTYEKSRVQYVEETIARYPKITPLSVEAFGGRMKLLGKKVFDNLDVAKVEAWAEELGRKFTQ